MAGEERQTYDFFILNDEDSEEDEGAAYKILVYLEGLTIRGRHPVGYYAPRNAQLGETIISNMIEAIDKSNIGFVLISNEAVTDKWWKLAHHMLLTNRLDKPQLRDTIVPVFLPGLEPESIPKELAMYEATCYDADPESDFWTKIRMCLE